MVNIHEGNGLGEMFIIVMAQLGYFSFFVVGRGIRVIPQFPFENLFIYRKSHEIQT